MNSRSNQLLRISQNCRDMYIDISLNVSLSLWSLFIIKCLFINLSKYQSYSRIVHSAFGSSLTSFKGNMVLIPLWSEIIGFIIHCRETKLWKFVNWPIHVVFAKFLFIDILIVFVIRIPRKAVLPLCNGENRLRISTQHFIQK